MIKASAKISPEIAVDFDIIRAMFDLDKGQLGRSLMAIATEEILVNMDMECDPDEMPWAPLSTEYHAWKRTIAPNAPMGVLYGIMKTYDQISGTQTIQADTAMMEYGLDIIAQTEAMKFTYGGFVTGTRQPPRPFYGLTFMAETRISAELDSRFNNAW
jgi:hypothetical protein